MKTDTLPIFLRNPGLTTIVREFGTGTRSRRGRQLGLPAFSAAPDRNRD